jgi:dTDP-glucose 4,6-dehydratase
MDTVLITGGSGFIGCNCGRWLLSHANFRVVNLDSLTNAGKFTSLWPLGNSDQYVFIRGGIADQALVRGLLDEYDCRAIVNLAAETHVDRSIGDPRSFMRTNVDGTFELLEASLGYWESLTGERRERFRFLHVSTNEVFGELPSQGSFTETSPYAPSSPYAASKAASDLLVHVYHRTYGLPVLITNCSCNYGPYQLPDKLIPLTIFNAIRGDPILVYGDGNNVRDWLHVDDHCRALELVLQRGTCGEVYNIGGHCERTNLEVVTAICETVDRLRPTPPLRPSIELLHFVDDRPGHDLRSAMDATKIGRTLGWKPSIDFAAGLESTVRWYLDNIGLINSACARQNEGRHAVNRPTGPARDARLIAEPGV